MVVLLRVRHARQPEVAHLEVAVAIEQQVGRLEVAVEDVRAVDVLERAEDLVEEVPAEGARVWGRERASRDRAGSGRRG